MNNRTSKLTAYSITVVMIAVQLITIFRFDSAKHVITWDGYGNYLYLPSVFIYHDIGLKDKKWQTKLHDEYLKDEPQYQTAPGIDGKQVNVYTTGVSICYLPFFLAGHMYAKISGYKADGMSLPYQWAMLIAALFYALWGIFILRALLLNFFDDRLTSILLIFIFLGTNIFIFSSVFPFGGPHALLFTINCAILYYTVKWHSLFKIKYAIYIGLLIGLVTIIRPTELVIAVVPLLWGVYNKDSLVFKMQLIKKYFSQFIILALCFIAVALIQVLYWMYSTGHLVSNNHAEGFDFLRPFLGKVLFSYKKGWLLYTPMMILSIIGFRSFYKNNKPGFWAIFIYFILNLWIISSWECWWYSASFGQRALLQSYSAMALPLGYFYFKLSNKTISRIMLGVGVLFVFLNLFQSYQFFYGIIDDEHMTKKYYWSAFFDVKKDMSKTQYLEINRDKTTFADINLDNYYSKVLYSNDIENKAKYKDAGIILDTMGYQSKGSLLIKNDVEYSLTYKCPYNLITNKDHLFIKVTFDLYPLDSAGFNACIVCTMQNHTGKSYGYHAYNLQEFHPKYKKWNQVELEYLTPIILHDDNILEVYYWNFQHKNAIIDNFKITAYEPKLSND